MPSRVVALWRPLLTKYTKHRNEQHVPEQTL